MIDYKAEAYRVAHENNCALTSMENAIVALCARVAGEATESAAKVCDAIHEAAVENREIMATQRAHTAVEQLIGASVAARECADEIRRSKGEG